MNQQIENQPILEIKNLCKTYSDFALKEVTLSLPQGAIMGLIGRNGAGKSTIMKIILGLTRAESGCVSLFGEEEPWENLEIKQQLGVVFDECCFPQTMKMEQLSKVLEKIYADWDVPTFHRYLRRFAIPQKTIIKEFSRGTKMKLSIAVALSHKARLLILDEPTSGLDPIVRNEILDLLLEYIQDSTRSVLISSHITSDLEKVADYIAFIDDGKILLSQSKDELIYEHAVAKGSPEQISAISPEYCISTHQNPWSSEALVHNAQAFRKAYPQIVCDNASLEDLMLFLCANKEEE